MEMRKLQLYVTERQYRLLKRRADKRGSIAAVVRDLIDESAAPGEAAADPFFQHVIAPKKGSGEPYDAQDAKRDLYRRQS
jgi:hypothetical protein